MCMLFGALCVCDFVDYYGNMAIWKGRRVVVGYTQTKLTNLIQLQTRDGQHKVDAERTAE